MELLLVIAPVPGVQEDALSPTEISLLKLIKMCCWLLLTLLGPANYFLSELSLAILKFSNPSRFGALMNLSLIVWEWLLKRLLADP